MVKQGPEGLRGQVHLEAAIVLPYPRFPPVEVSLHTAVSVRAISIQQPVLQHPAAAGAGGVIDDPGSPLPPLVTLPVLVLYVEVTDVVRLFQGVPIVGGGYRAVGAGDVGIPAAASDQVGTGLEAATEDELLGA